MLSHVSFYFGIVQASFISQIDLQEISFSDLLGMLKRVFGRPFYRLLFNDLNLFYIDDTVVIVFKVLHCKIVKLLQSGGFLRFSEMSFCAFLLFLAVSTDRVIFLFLEFLQFWFFGVLCSLDCICLKSFLSGS